MKIVRFMHQGITSYGVLDGENIKVLEGDIFKNQSFSGQEYPLSAVKLLAPVEPSNLICVGLNYKLHALESGVPVPAEPMLFMCSTASIIGPDEEIVLDSPTQRIDYEAEIAIVIGRTARNISSAYYADYVFGYTITNDVSNRDLQRKDGQFTRAKSFDTYKPTGPCIETEVNPENLAINLWQNGELRQSSNTNDMIFPIGKIVEFVSGITTLQPGDVIITGTPSGVGPMQSGDVIEIEIEGIGRLKNTVQ